jgi:hypothetical protein
LLRGFLLVYKLNCLYKICSEKLALFKYLWQNIGMFLGKKKSMNKAQTSSFAHPVHISCCA